MTIAPLANYRQRTIALQVSVARVEEIQASYLADQTKEPAAQ